MSAETWIKEYMPEPADSPEAQAKPVSHCLRKWRGATKERLEKHGLRIMPSNGANNCALCVRHGFKPFPSFAHSDCSKCELAQTLGYPCDNGNDDGGNENQGPYCIFHDTGDPSAMIEALEKTLAKYPHL